MLTKTSTHAEVVAEWVRVLRSGKFKQGRSRLRNENNEYCCLGALCELAVSAEVIPPLMFNSVEKTFKYGDSFTAYLPPDVGEWSGLTSRNAGYKLESDGTNDLASQNDQGASFARIADIIESNPEGLFGGNRES